MKYPTALLFGCALIASVFSAENKSPATAATSAHAGAAVQWIAFPDSRLELRGLPWFAENSPELWRLPKSAKPRIPKGAWARAIAPDGGRIRFTSTTSRLALRVEVVSTQKKLAYFDAYVDDQPVGSAGSTGPKTTELVLFADRDGRSKNLTIYLPNTSEVRVLAVGIDPGATLTVPPPFAAPAPLMCYGSSVLQGTGAEHPSKTYPAVLARRLNLDFVNLGFGGAGKAEPDVVALVNQPDACGYLFDLGKSYGAQSEEAFVKMLATIRAKHPAVPILCVTPIYSTNEPKDKAYFEKSVRLRNMMRDAAVAQRNAGDRNIHVVEGLELFGPADQDLFRDPQHPNDAGNERMCERLVDLVRRLVLNRN